MVSTLATLTPVAFVSVILVSICSSAAGAAVKKIDVLIWALLHCSQLQVWALGILPRVSVRPS